MDASVVVPWSGTGETDAEGTGTESVIVVPRTENITYAADSVANGAGGNELNADAVTVEYQVYDVSTADELFYSMKEAKAAAEDVNVKINLLNDIDLNGKEQTWSSEYVEPDYQENSWFYIEGNGYTIYNMKTTSYIVDSDTSKDQNRGTASFLGTLGDHSANGGYDTGTKKKVVLKNLNFSNCLVFSTQSCTSVVVSFNRGQLYMENVNVKDSFVYSSQAQTGALLGRQQSKTGDTFLRNCSSQNCYVFGTDHSGGLTGCQHNVGVNNYKVKYNAAFPNSPETWMAKHVSGEEKEATFPEMVENCYSVDSELYSLGGDGDSGGLLSCGGKLICRNCFTNNIVYGNTRTGAFFGRIVTTDSLKGGMYDDMGARTVEIYFENCYASGSIEGISKIGGFVGLEAGHASAEFGVAVYKNCYTTAMVGMDYAGNQLGGFIGHENTSYLQKASIIIGKDENNQPVYNQYNGSVYINCYAAGEVGNILTDTNTTQSGIYNRLGGFLGEAGFYGTRGESDYASGKWNGNYINCYYDMQTTAMRERACGRADQFTDRPDYSTCANSDMESQIPGVTGIYTQTSTAKNIQGLTDTDGIMQGTVWTYVTDMYPMLNSFSDDTTVKANFGTLANADQEVVKITSIVENEDGTVTDGASTLFIDDSAADGVDAANADGMDDEGADGTDDTAADGEDDADVEESDGTAAADDADVEGTDDAAADGTDDGADDADDAATDGADDAAGDADDADVDKTDDTAADGEDDSNTSGVNALSLDDVDTDAGTSTGTGVTDGADSSTGTTGEGTTAGTGDGSTGTTDEDATPGETGSSNETDGDSSTGTTEEGATPGTGDSSTGTNEEGTTPGTGDSSTGTTEGTGTTSTENSGELLVDGGISTAIAANAAAIAEDGETTTQTVALYDDATKARIREQLAKKEELVKKYSQASVSTVLLSHWDSAMNMDTGTLDGETSWTVGLLQNKLTQKAYAENDANKWERDTDGMYWEIAYENLAAGTYPFKVQAGTSWAYNFGSDKFNGANCSLTIAEDSDVKIKFDYAGSASVTGENTNFRIWAEVYGEGLYNEDGTEKENPVVTETIELGENAKTAKQNLWTIVGSFENVSANANWNPAYEAFDMEFVGTGQGNGDYELTTTLPAGTYQFKVARDHDWGESYGASGGDSNMEITLSNECEVTFTFNENTHTTEVTTTADDTLTSVKTEKEEIEFDGYSLIAPAAITGHEWLDGLEAAEDGKMTLKGEGIYEVSFVISGEEKFGKIYGYKVIEDAKDEGPNNYFYLGKPADDITSVTLIFQYDPATGDVQVRCDEIDDLLDENPEVDYYGVLGSKKLTGYTWGKDENDEDVAGTGKMSCNTDREWSITYENVEAGTHSFKVVADSSFSSGIDYGAYDGENYQFTTTETANITITFDEDTKRIEVSSNPANAIEKSRYVISGSSALTGDSWNVSSTANEMTYDDYTGVYTKTYTNLTSGQKYAFKIVEFGVDDKAYPESFQIVGEEDETYKLEIKYNKKEGKTKYCLYDSTGKDVTEECITEAETEFWSVIGDESLTGYSWLGEDNKQQAEAAEKGRMTLGDDGKYSVTLSGVKVTETIQNMGFKVVAEGTWDTGISYGTKSGDNYTIALVASGVSACDVTITFDPETHEITVSTNPEECLLDGGINEADLEWFVAGDYRLVSDDAYNTPATVYDTVRDITYGFKFTSGSGLSWDYSNTRNTDSSFFEYMGKDEAGNTTGFSLYYTVENKEITGTFKEKVITLETASENGYTQYSCERFMPGKQWLTVTTTGTDNVTGNRNLRLIPTAYLEAGNEADIYVLQSESDSKREDVSNVVTYRENSLVSEGITYEGLTGEIFDRYNFALTAGYAITDRAGLGYYGNYSEQEIRTYDKDDLRENTVSADTASEVSQTYFAMSSVFNQSAAYDDGNVASGETSNLVVDELVDQSLIGSSYDDGTNGAKTIVKIYKKTVDADGKVSYPKVFMEKNTPDADGNNQSKSAYQKNYLKWTGQMPFEADDEGTYYVTYFWSLSDGRFLTDSKKVYIHSELSGIEKTVDKSYIEKTETSDGETLTYTVTYTNKVDGDFTICDVLPFNEDVRTDTSKKSGVNSSVIGNNTGITLKSIEVTASAQAGADGEAAPAVSVTGKEYTSDTDIRNYTYTTEDNTKNPAENIAGAVNAASDIDWNTWSSGDVANATGIRITGTQTGKGSSTITVIYTVEVENAEKADYYVNNAFFTVTDHTSAKSVEGYSTPVTTAVVGRELSGYVWLDSDIDGKFDETEPAIQGVNVNLVKKITDSSDSVTYASTGFTATTDANGFYEFTDIDVSGEDYQVQFSAAGDVTVKYSKIDNTKTDQTISFNDLNLSRRLSPYQVTEKSKSRNIAKLVSGDTDTDTGKLYGIDESLPSAEDIYKNNNQTRYQTGSVTDYYFTRLYQNIGLTEVTEEKTSSLTIRKVDADKETVLEGVKFQLEYRLDDTEEYKPVTYYEGDNGEYIFVDPDDEQSEAVAQDIDTTDETVTTNEKGEIRFTNLPVADYRLTEVETLAGYNLLAEKLEFRLPYIMKDSNQDGYITGNESEENVKSGLEAGVTYYYDITYTVTNSRLPDMPSAGGSNNFIPIAIAAVLFTSSIAIYGIYTVKKNKKNKAQ